MQQQLSGVSILLVEDNPEGREVLETVLTLAGASVRTASNAEEALELLRGSVPAVIITDIKMPGHNGFWLLDQVRALPLPSAVPVIAYTGHVSPSTTTSRCICWGTSCPGHCGGVYPATFWNDRH